MKHCSASCNFFIVTIPEYGCNVDLVDENSKLIKHLITHSCLNLYLIISWNHLELDRFQLSHLKRKADERKQGAMNGFVRILSIVFLVAVVRGKKRVEKTLNCDGPVPTIFKLGDASCKCNDAAHAGALKYANGKVYDAKRSELHEEESNI